ncbi:MAG TPA: hypothetical protein VFC50_03660 [Candidatus Dormibacteraeota bacterium]|nr:hypothetical protein [Candidatus Dormibacteraeota bacterium]
MATDQLTTTSNSQSQTTTQAGNLQPTGQGSIGGTSSSSVQPDTANSLLSGGQGVPIQGTALSTVNLNPPATATASKPTVAAPVKPPHHANTVFLGFSGLLFLVAIVLFWTTSRSVKSTT